jgi:hypothetical protein
LAKGAGFTALAVGAFVFVVFAKRRDPFSDWIETPVLPGIRRLPVILSNTS